VAVVVRAGPAGGGGADVSPSTGAERDAVRDLLKKMRSKSEETRNGGPTPARVTVRLPADAQLWVNDVACPLTSDTRSFVTPRLERGQRYSYTLRAEVRRDGRPVTQTRRVNIAAGRQVNVRFDFATELTTTGR
jgi:uncharacterized protein (TIGR03000 family)